MLFLCLLGMVDHLPDLLSQWRKFVKVLSPRYVRHAQAYYSGVTRLSTIKVVSRRHQLPAFQRNATLKKATAAGQKLC